MRRCKGLLTILAMIPWVGAACRPEPERVRPVTTATSAPGAPTQDDMRPPPSTTSHPATQPATQPTTKPATQQANQAADAPPPEMPRKPKRPPITWTKLVDVFDKAADADIVSTWEGGNKLVVDTTNVEQLIIDFRELPREARRNGPPWNLLIDQQGIEITGRRGPFYIFQRNRNGAWDVIGPRPRPRD
jgi:hypothetical protein